MKIDFRKIIGSYNKELPALDKTTAWYEFLSYCECCKSLNVSGQPHITRYIRYRTYLKEVGIL